MSKFYQNPFCNKCGRFHLDPDDLCGYSNRQQPVEAEGDYFKEVLMELEDCQFGTFDSKIIKIVKQIHNHAIDDAVGVVTAMLNGDDTVFISYKSIIAAITTLKK